MSNNNDNTQVLEPIDEEIVTEEPVVEEATEVAPAVTKTKKELKKERKEIKKRKREAKREAFMHSARSMKVQQAIITILTVVVIISMLVCSISAITATKNLMNADTSSNSATTNNDSAAQPNTNTQTSTPNTSTTPDSTDTNTGDTNTGDTNTGDSNTGDANTGDTNTGDSNTDAPAGTPDLSTKEGAVAYYKAAHAKVLAEAKSVTRTLDNNTQDNNYLEVGGNSALAGVASTLMGMFLKANEEPIVHTGADIAANFPPSKNSADGLTADMIGEYSVKEEGDNYIISLTLNSSEASPDLGDNAAHLVNIVESKTVEEAAAGFVGFTGLRNEYIAPVITATINKTSGQMTDLHTVCPSYMKFDKATVMSIINVNNVGIGLQYETKWTIQW